MKLFKAIYPDNSNEYVAEMLHRSKNAVKCRAKQIRKNFDDLPAERKAEVWAKMHETRNKAIRRDQLRLRWGLEPLGALVKRIR